MMGVTSAQKSLDAASSVVDEYLTGTRVCLMYQSC